MKGQKFVYVGLHLSARRSKAIEICTKTSGKSKINHNDDIFSNFILKIPKKSYVGFHFTGIRSKATEIMTAISKIPQIFHIFANFAAKTP